MDSEKKIASFDSSTQQQQNIKTQTSKLNIVWWIVIVILIGAGVFANTYFSSVAWAVRLAGWIVLACILVFLVLQTNAGKKSLKFALDARVELRKVTWSTRQETVQTTLIITVLVILMALILWGMDSILLWAINWLMGQKG
jgi:preprotein translocase subunit SecE